VTDDDRATPAGGTESGPEPRTAAGLPVVSGAPTPPELAAIVAVIEAQAREIEADALPARPAHRTAWDRSRASLRRPLSPGTGSWRGFGADSS
jgi:hypothetical protein